ncbi:MAG: hypothetical protein D6731_06530 [Planctomycetota bacterium]|nr:MAG: hypothetical protein D6731_06530 [Planctomycetota bacterium]
MAADLKVSQSLVYKWCSQDESGARNPLDRLRGIVLSTRDTGPVEWLCKQFGGTFVEDPPTNLDDFDAEYIAHTQHMLQNFSELLRVISESIHDDQTVDRREAEEIRQQWERLKRYAETFVAACEAGLFDRGER